MHSLKNNKAPERNVILNEIIRFQIPRDWTTSLITKIFTGKDSSSDLGNYRLITLMHTPSKIFAKLLSERLWQLAGDNNITNEAQAGWLRNEYGG